MKPAVRSALAAVLALAGGVFLVLERQAHHAQAEALEGLRREVAELRQARVAFPPPGPPAPASRMDSAQLERMSELVAGLVAARLAAQGPPPAARAEPQPPPPEAAPAPPLTAEQQASLTRATEIVDVSIRSGRLSQEDVLALKRLKAEAGAPAAFKALSRRIIIAVNQGQLVPESGSLMLP